MHPDHPLPPARLLEPDPARLRRGHYRTSGRVGLARQHQAETPGWPEKLAMAVGSALQGLLHADGVVVGEEGLAEVGEGSEPDGGLADGEEPAAPQAPLNRPSRVS